MALISLADFLLVVPQFLLSLVYLSTSNHFYNKVSDAVKIIFLILNIFDEVGFYWGFFLTCLMIHLFK